MLSLAVVRLKWLTDVRRSAWYLLLFNQTTHSNKGGESRILVRDWRAGNRPSLETCDWTNGHAAGLRATYRRRVYVASVLG